MPTQATSKLRNDISDNIINPNTPFINSQNEIAVSEDIVAADVETVEEVHEQEKMVYPKEQQSRNILDLISESEESESSADEDVGTDDEDSSDDETGNEQESVPLSNPNPVANPLRAILSWNNPFNQPNSKAALEKQKASKPGARFVETEAEVEEDEFMNYGGLEGQNQYDLSMLNDDSAEPINLEAVLELHKYEDS
jgi:hypothetical protein